MRKLKSIGSVLFFVGLLVAFAATPAAAADKWEKGWVSDSKCGVKGAGLGHEQCGKKCLAAGEHVVFVNEFNHKVFNVENPDTLNGLMGHRVSVQGTVNEATGTIHVDKVNSLPEKGQKKAEAASMSD